MCCFTVNHLLAEKTAALAAAHASSPDRVLAEKRHADGTTFDDVTYVVAFDLCLSTGCKCTCLLLCFR